MNEEVEGEDDCDVRSEEIGIRSGHVHVNFNKVTNIRRSSLSSVKRGRYNIFFNS